MGKVRHCQRRVKPWESFDQYLIAPASTLDGNSEADTVRAEVWCLDHALIGVLAQY